MPYNSLRPVREKKGMTIAQVAGKTSISIRTLQSYESGERAISADDLRKLSRVLYASTTELLQPTVPPPPPPAPPPRPVEPAPVREAVPVTPAADLADRLPGDVRAEAEVHRPPSGRPSFGRPPSPRPPRPPREPFTPRPPGPSTAGQIDQIRNLGRRLGLDDSALVERIGASLESLDHTAARAAIAVLRKDMEESGTWQPRVQESPDQEAEYLAKLRDRRVPIDVVLINGERFQGLIESFTPYVVQLRDVQSGADVYVRKLAIAYYRTEGPAHDAQ